MTAKISILFTIALFFTVFSQAQSERLRLIPLFENEPEEEPVTDIVLLNNEEDLLPLKRLDTLRIAFIPLGMEAESTLLDYRPNQTGFNTTPSFSY